MAVGGDECCRRLAARLHRHTPSSSKPRPDHCSGSCYLHTQLPAPSHKPPSHSPPGQPLTPRPTTSLSAATQSIHIICSLATPPTKRPTAALPLEHHGGMVCVVVQQRARRADRARYLVQLVRGRHTTCPAPDDTVELLLML
jgi:hypothetical protein